jgi:ATP-dependent protease ClpP protease subunit
MRALLFAGLLLLAAPASVAGDDTSAVYHLKGDIQEGQADQLRELAHWAKKGSAKELLILIDSNGGNAQEGLALYNAIHSAGVPTRCLVVGVAASAAAVALMGCQARMAKKEAVVLFHNPIVSVNHPGVMTLEMAHDMSTKLGTLADAYASIVACRLGLTAQEYRRKIANGALWQMTATEALAAHAVDLIVP